MYVFGHLPTDAYAILAAIVQQEFKHPKFKHPNGIPNLQHVARTIVSHCVDQVCTFVDCNSSIKLEMFVSPFHGKIGNPVKYKNDECRMARC